MYLKLTTGVLVAIGSSGFASGQEAAWYADVGYQYASSEFAGLDADFSNVSGHVGYDFNRTFGLEAEGAIGIGDSNNIPNYELGLDYSLGLFGKLKAPISRTVEVFGRAGIVTSRFTEDAELSDLLFEEEVDRNAIAFGVGVNFLISGRNGMRVEYTRYDYDVDDISIDANAFFVGYYRRF